MANKFIRYNTGSTYYEYDTSVAQDGSGPWLILPLDAAQIASGTFPTARIPSLDASKITTGQLALARGGTNADLSATGGASKFLRQNSAGAAVTVVQPAIADLSDGATIIIPTYGDWTPVIGGSTSETGQTYTRQIGKWAKVGRLVHYQFYVTLSAKGTITGAVRIKGLVHTSLNVTNAYSCGRIEWFTLATNWVNMTAELPPNSTFMNILGLTAAGASLNTALATADINNTTEFIGAGTYISDT